MRFNYSFHNLQFLSKFSLNITHFWVLTILIYDLKDLRWQIGETWTCVGVRNVSFLGNFVYVINEWSLVLVKLFQVSVSFYFNISPYSAVTLRRIRITKYTNLKQSTKYETKYLRLDRVKFVKYSLQKTWREMVCFKRPYYFKILKGVFFKFYLVHSWVLCFIYHMTRTMIPNIKCLKLLQS